MPLLHAFTQTVSIEGGPSDGRVRDLSLRRSANERVTTCDFTVEDDPAGAATFDACALGKTVTVSQVGGGYRADFKGDIVAVHDERGSNWTQRKVTCYSLEARAKWTRFQDEWNEVRADTIVSQAWTNYGSGVAPGGVSVESNADLLSMSSAFDSLFDLMDKIARRTAWAWRIDPVTEVMEFYDPLGRDSPTWNQTEQDIEGGTLRVKRDLKQVQNVARTQVWLYRRRNKTVEAIAAGDCVKAVRATDMLPPYGWELASEPKVIDDFTDNVDREVKLTEDGWLQFDPPIVPELQATGTELFGKFKVEVEVALEWRRKVWLVAQSEASIAQFGRREAQPINDDGGQTKAEGAQRLQEFLERYAFPTIEVSGNALQLGFEPDTIAQVSLNDPPLSAALYVTSVTHTTRENDLQVQVDFASPDTVLDSAGAAASGPQRAASTDIDVVDELHRRIIQLERDEAHPRGIVGQVTADLGSFGGAEPTRVGTGWTGETIADQLPPTRIREGWGHSSERSIALPNVEDAAGGEGSQGWSEQTTAFDMDRSEPDEGHGWTAETIAHVADLAVASFTGGWGERVTATKSAGTSPAVNGSTVNGGTVN